MDDFCEKLEYAGFPFSRKATADKREALLSALSQDPRPAYQQDGEQYGFEFSGFDVRFSVDGDTLTVFDVAPAGSQKLK